ncbi:hypothetical protein VTL71DRAFT_6999 [Oculimacula yallundae]|uniref:Uncharacterized protein n=1 Tax=Oculimacula yallundae TaxID=86028 RepID=A0ABR4BWA7_9HELO
MNRRFGLKEGLRKKLPSDYHGNDGRIAMNIGCCTYEEAGCELDWVLVFEKTVDTDARGVSRKVSVFRSKL